MAATLRDRVLQTTTGTGTGTLTLAPASDVRYVTFVDAGLTDLPTFYAVVARGVNEWEVGTGEVSAGGVLTRTAIYGNHLGTTVAVDFGAGTKDVFCTLPASRAVALNATDDDLALPGSVALGAGESVTVDGDPLVVGESGGVERVVSLDAAAYAALSPPDANTLYVVTP